MPAQQTVKVQLLYPYAGPDGCKPARTIIETDADTAKHLLTTHQARTMEEVEIERRQQEAAKAARKAAAGH